MYGKVIITTRQLTIELFSKESIVINESELEKLFKTWLEKECTKMPSIFSFTHYGFYLIQNKFHY